MPRKSASAGKRAAPPVAMDTPVAKVAGARMSGVRHSGLLARDEEQRRDGGGGEGDETRGVAAAMTPRYAALDTAEEDGRGFPRVSGREMFSFRGRSRSSVGVARLSGATPLAKRSRISTEADEGKESATEAMEVGNAVSNRTKEAPKVSKHRKDLSLDSDLSDFSDGGDDEDLRSLAAKLSRGEAAVGGASEELLEDYFTAHSSKSGLTSDHTLAKLAQPKMDQDSVQSALSSVPSRFHGDCQLLYEEYRGMFSYWLFQLSNGFNILLFGLGSKRKLLEEFRSSRLSESAHLVVNGFFPGLTIKQVLSDLSVSLLGHEGASFKSTTEHAHFIATELERGHRERLVGGPSKQGRQYHELYLIIHNIDGAMLRGEAAQTALSVLAQSPCIHVLASIDHINAPLLWDEKKLSRFKWLWYDVTTYEPYLQETSYENSLLIQQSGTLALSSLKHVTSSLTPNARGIFELLGRYQLENRAENEATYQGMSFHECYLKCREKFLVNSDLTLRAQLTEFRDHKLVRVRRGKDGVEYLFIPIDDAALGQFLEQQADEN